jgi:hypothetical protein
LIWAAIVGDINREDLRAVIDVGAAMLDAPPTGDLEILTVERTEDV